MNELAGYINLVSLQKRLNRVPLKLFVQEQQISVSTSTFHLLFIWDYNLKCTRKHSLFSEIEIINFINENCTFPKHPPM